MIDSPFCNSCHDVIDDIIHHFVDCRGLNGFWHSLESWWNRTAEYSVTLSKKHIILGFYYDNMYFSSINYVVMLAKSYIYRQVNCERIVDFYNFLSILKQKLEIEKYVCTSTGKIQLFDKRWSSILDKL